uniref:Integrase catalytic domain-containing protein n=1 Tax=Amphimedon queenslandica TaxID=400682 RepID=A0A1X7SZT2_AMPQE
GVAWKWSSEAHAAFKHSKELSDDNVLAHFDSETELVLACDASQYSIGAVLAHHYTDGSERPIAVASHESFNPNWTKQAELSALDGCILWASRVVVPKQGREHLLLELHEGHVGISKAKDIERVVKGRAKYNEPTFLSQEFKEYLQQNGVCHVTSAPYDPASNGLAE